MAGIDRHTGRVITNLGSALQAVEVILTTRIGSRIMRREFGGGADELLGRLLTADHVAVFRQLVATAIDLWEPRLAIRRIALEGSAEELRRGEAGFVLEADWRPRGHLGDLTVERTIGFSARFPGAGRVEVLVS